MPSSHRASPGLGKAIRHLREERGMAQEALAHDADSTASTIGAIERGLSSPSWGSVEAIAAALGVTVAELAKLVKKFER